MDRRAITPFEEQVLAAQEVLKSYALRLTSDLDVAEDLLQETTAKLLAAEADYHDEGKFVAWGMVVMKHLFVDYYNRQQREQAILVYQNEVECKGVAELDTTDELYVEISALSELLSQPLCLYIKGYKYREIAKILDIPMGTVKSRINAARRCLRARLEEPPLC